MLSENFGARGHFLKLQNSEWSRGFGDHFESLRGGEGQFAHCFGAGRQHAGHAAVVSAPTCRTRLAAHEVARRASHIEAIAETS
jgi:hypothetical protein